MKIFLASGNAHKVAELGALAARDGLAVEILSARAVGGMPTVVEDAGTFAGNARKKAHALRARIVEAGGAGAAEARHEVEPDKTGGGASGPALPQTWVLADDSGLCVDALGGGPGVESAYFAGPAGDVAANLAKLVEVMREVPDAERGAHFVCVLLLVGPDGSEHVFEGRCDGRLLREPQGGAGFGYDPLIVPEGHKLSFAELGEAVKNGISHRARAWAKLAEWVRAGAK